MCRCRKSYYTQNPRGRVELIENEVFICLHFTHAPTTGLALPCALFAWCSSLHFVLPVFIYFLCTFSFFAYRLSGANDSSNTNVCFRQIVESYVDDRIREVLRERVFRRALYRMRMTSLCYCHRYYVCWCFRDVDIKTPTAVLPVALIRIVH